MFTIEKLERTGGCKISGKRKQPTSMITPLEVTTGSSVLFPTVLTKLFVICFTAFQQMLLAWNRTWIL